MITDLNKDLTITQYNYLNLPQQISNNTDATNEINFLYDAAGIKLRKQTKINNAPEKTVDYIGSFVYEDNKLRYLLTNEGRVMVNDDGTYEYQYFLKDHLGNTRVTFNENEDIIQEDAYYPFGMQMNGLCYETGLDYKNKYLYNGKELQDEFGLDWYDYGARFYDAQIGRWHVGDPSSERYVSLSPYNYVINNPLSLVDLNGEDPIDPRTGKPFYINLWRDGVSYYDESKNNRDVELSRRIPRHLFGLKSFPLTRERCKPDGLWSGAAYNKHKSSISETSSVAKSQLENIFNVSDITSYGAPDDYVWGNAAESGTYTFLNSTYSESEWLHRDENSFDVIEVQDNYISKSATLIRGENEEFNIESVTSFTIEKGDIQTRTKKTWWGGTKTIKYRTLNVTESTQHYKNNKDSGYAIVKNYQTEEIIK